MPATRFWPFRRWTALVGSVFLLLALLVLILVSRQVTGWPGDGDVGSLVLAALAVALVPILLTVADGIATAGGSIGIAGVTVSFAATSQAVAADLETTTLTQNLGPSDGAVIPSDSLTSILDALRNARRSDVTVVDLGRGQDWWETRLFILIAGAAQRDRPRAIAFVGDHGGRSAQFLGWAAPERLLAAHLDGDEQFRTHYARSIAEAAQWRLGLPAGTGPGDQPAVILPWGGQQYLPAMMDGRADPAFALELYLQQALDSDGADELRRPVTAVRLQDLYGVDLITDAIEVGARAAAWPGLLADSREDFFALTENGRFRGLVPRDSLVSVLLAQLIEATEAGTGRP